MRRFRAVGSGITTLSPGQRAHRARRLRSAPPVKNINIIYRILADARDGVNHRLAMSLAFGLVSGRAISLALGLARERASGLVRGSVRAGPGTRCEGRPEGWSE